ncbi:MAG: cation transporter [Actinobacteria bacterium]|nr:cation transporter [Actinomycetota bacterium]
MATVIKVAGMSCGHCVATVEKAARSVPGVTKAVVDLKGGSVALEGVFDRERVIEAIKAAGYQAS